MEEDLSSSPEEKRNEATLIYSAEVINFLRTPKKLLINRISVSAGPEMRCKQRDAAFLDGTENLRITADRKEQVETAARKVITRREDGKARLIASSNDR